MTRNKLNKLVQGLIDQYGDVVVVEGYDYYKSKIILKEGEESEDNIILRIKLSDYIKTENVIPNRNTFLKLAEIAFGKEKPYSMPIEIEESKKYTIVKNKLIFVKRGKKNFSNYLVLILTL